MFFTHCVKLLLECCNYIVIFLYKILTCLSGFGFVLCRKKRQLRWCIVCTDKHVHVQYKQRNPRGRFFVAHSVYACEIQIVKAECWPCEEQTYFHYSTGRIHFIGHGQRHALRWLAIGSSFSKSSCHFLSLLPPELLVLGCKLQSCWLFWQVVYSSLNLKFPSQNGYFPAMLLVGMCF